MPEPLAELDSLGNLDGVGAAGDPRALDLACLGVAGPERDAPSMHVHTHLGECSTFVMVKGLQTLGYSLDEIAGLCPCGNIGGLEMSLDSRMRELRARISKMESTVLVCESIRPACPGRGPSPKGGPT